MAAPALYWWHLTLDMTVERGVQRAQLAMGRSKVGVMPAGDLTKDEDRVRLIGANFVAIVKCLPQGKDKILAIIIVAGHNGEQTRGWMEGLRDAMKSGVFE